MERSRLRIISPKNPAAKPVSAQPLLKSATEEIAFDPEWCTNWEVVFDVKLRLVVEVSAVGMVSVVIEVRFSRPFFVLLQLTLFLSGCILPPCISFRSVTPVGT